jgi:hypothetical protein
MTTSNETKRNGEPKFSTTTLGPDRVQVNLREAAPQHEFMTTSLGTMLGVIYKTEVGWQAFTVAGNVETPLSVDETHSKASAMRALYAARIQEVRRKAERADLDFSWEASEAVDVFIKWVLGTVESSQKRANEAAMKFVGRASEPDAEFVYLLESCARDAVMLQHEAQLTKAFERKMLEVVDSFVGRRVTGREALLALRQFARDAYDRETRTFLAYQPWSPNSSNVMTNATGLFKTDGTRDYLRSFLADNVLRTLDYALRTVDAEVN